MKQDNNDFFKLIFDTEAVKHNDGLSALLRTKSDNELSEIELDMVSAAANPDYEKFKLFLEGKGIK